MIDMNKLYLCVLALFFIVQIHAQDIEVKKFEPLEKDQTAVTSPRKDINGNACGLVKVALKEPGAEFEGNVMGDVQFTGKEYLVYLPNGTKRLGIKHPDYLPTTIVFADYGTKRVASSTTYELKVKANKKKAKVDDSKKGMAVFNIKPSNAMLLIDGQIADGTGGAYTLSLPYGMHYYTVKLKDFSINNQMVKIDKNAKTINVDLTEYFAFVSIACEDSDAEIFINNELQGTGKTNSLLLPSVCTINLRKEGYHSLSRTIELQENDSVNIRFQKMEMIKGKLSVNYGPKGSEVYINGMKAGITPLEKDLPVGKYRIEVRRDNYVPIAQEVTIADEQRFDFSGNLVETPIGRVFNVANNGDFDAQMDLAQCYFDGYQKFISRHSSGSTEEQNYYNAFSGIKRDLKESNKWAVVASKNTTSEMTWNHQPAYELLLTIFLTTKQYANSFFYAKKAYESERLNLTRKARGFLRNSYWLAWHYFYGRGVEMNYSKAVSYLDEFRQYHLNAPKGNCTREELIWWAERAIGKDDYEAIKNDF